MYPWGCCLRLFMPLSFMRDKSNYQVLNRKKKSYVLCNDHLPVMKTMRQWILCFLFLKQPEVNAIRCKKEKTFYIHSQSFLLYYHQEYKHKRICFMKYTCSCSSLGAELWWLNFSIPSDTGIHHLSTLLTLSNRHSWLAFPSHWRRYKSLLFSCTTASMHFPERMWTIIPFSWKSQYCWWISGPSSVQFWRITCSCLTAKHRCCGLPKWIPFLLVCLRCCCCRLSLQGASLMAQPRMSPSAWQSTQKPSPVLWSFPENLGLNSDGYSSG